MMKGVRRLCNLVLQGYKKKKESFMDSGMFTKNDTESIYDPEYVTRDLQRPTLRQSGIMIGYDGGQRLRLERQALPMEQCIYRQQISSVHVLDNARLMV